MSKDKVEKCIEEGTRQQERHQGLRKVTMNTSRVYAHIEKAMHNFAAISDFHKIGYSDWSPSAGFYALYHLLLAIIAKAGYESRNQSCTFALVETMIEHKKLIMITKEDLREIFDASVRSNLEHSSKILDLRERYQYSTGTILEEQEFERFKERVKRLFDKLRLELER